MSDYHPESAERVTLAWIKVERAVRAYVLAVVSRYADADDVVQSVAVTMVERFGDYDASRPLLPWVLGIARFKLREYIRRRGRDRLVLDESVLDQLEAAYVEIADEIQPTGRALWDCLKRLADRQRRAFTLRYRDDLPPRVIAETMDTSSSAISNLLTRGRLALRRCIAQRLAADSDEVFA